MTDSPTCQGGLGNRPPAVTSSQLCLHTASAFASPAFAPVLDAENLDQLCPSIPLIAQLWAGTGLFVTFDQGLSVRGKKFQRNGCERHSCVCVSIKALPVFLGLLRPLGPQALSLHLESTTDPSI